MLLWLIIKLIYKFIFGSNLIIIFKILGNSLRRGLVENFLGYSRAGTVVKFAGRLHFGTLPRDFLLASTL